MMINDESELIPKYQPELNLKLFFQEFYYKYYKEIKGFFIFILFLLIIFLNLGKNYGPTNNICMCVICKNENRYIREFVEFYKKMKVDKIFLYDNNDIDGERLGDVIQDYMDNEYVKVTNYRGLVSPQLKSYIDCYFKNLKAYDWLIFYDVDEYIYLKDFSDIKSFLSDKRFKKCQRVRLNWVMYTDNNLLYYDNRTLEERFTEKEPNARNNTTGGQQEIKSIVRGHRGSINIHCIHVIDRSLKSCDGFGKRQYVDGITTPISDYEYYYLKHFYSKSTEEFVEKIMRSDAFYRKGEDKRLFKIRRYFAYNEITKEKLDFIEKKTKLNLSEFRNRIKK